jgi:BirA family transcriptional regulator, biotin operon repressor / biotin---[acetyl-CoA-carboxylase] ligase
MSAPERLDAARLRQAAVELRIGAEIIVLDSTASTNDTIREMARDGRPEGLVVFAEHQTAGRGQHGKKWESAGHKGLWFSVLLRPALDLQESARLTEWAAHTVASTVRDFCGLNPTVKAPNDVCIGNRKVGGVLVEMRAQPQAAHVAILGIGLNVNHAAADFPKELQERATSLGIEGNRQFDRHDIAVALLQNLDRTYAELFGRGTN